MSEREGEKLMSTQPYFEAVARQMPQARHAA